MSHLPLSALKMPFFGGAFLFIHFALFFPEPGTESSPQKGQQIADLMAKMKSAYSQVDNYQTETEVTVYREGQVTETERFLYTFKKPNHVRLDMESPYPGMILAYPDKNGKVIAKPAGLAGFLKLHLSPDNALLMTAAGQRIDQTDLGRLIHNISLSISDQRQGELKVYEKDGLVLIEVLAEDHFLAGVSTLYQFSVDKTNWLPVEVKEFTPERTLKRKVMFKNLKTSISIPDSFFRINGGDSEYDRPAR